MPVTGYCEPLVSQQHGEEQGGREEHVRLGFNGDKEREGERGEGEGSVTWGKKKRVKGRSEEEREEGVRGSERGRDDGEE